MKFNYKSILLILALTASFILMSIYIIDKRVNTLKEERYSEISKLMREDLKHHISEKKEMVLNISLSLATNKLIKDSLLHNQDYKQFDFKEFSLKFRNNTTLKNLFFQIISPEGISLYRSWTDKHGDDLKKVRIDVAQIIKAPKITTSISTGKFDLTFKSMVPIYDGNKLLGIFEALAKFNSIAIQMANEGYETVILVDKSYKKQLTQAFTKKFINNYYIANLNSNPSLLKIIKEDTVEYFLQHKETYLLDHEHNMLISLYTLEDMHKKDMAYFIMFHDLNKTDMSDITEMKNHLIVLFTAIFFIGVSFAYYFYVKKYKSFIDNLNIELEEKVNEKTKALQHMEYYDTLTNLPNRVSLTQQLNRSMLLFETMKNKLVIVYLDLDNFDNVNRSYGEGIGNKLLIEISERLNNLLEKDDFCARLGGDEFALLFHNCTNIESIKKSMDIVLKTISKPVLINNIEISTTASIGLTYYPQEEKIDAEQLLRQADQAMYQAKLTGKNKYYIFNPDKDMHIREDNEKLEQINRAIENDEFVMYYQPKVDLKLGKIIGAEALVRWQHPEKGILSPAFFLPDLKGDYLNITFDEMIINKVLKQIRQWIQNGFDIPVSINLSAIYIQQKDFIERFQAILKEYSDIPASNIELEILETSSIGDMTHVVKVITTLKQTGVRFSLDDFGTGYSSLIYLRHLPVQTIKIDQSFVRNMLENHEDFTIVDAVIKLATSFNKSVIAEGVEEIEHAKILLQLGCSLAQGYAIAKPMPADELSQWEARWKNEQSWKDIKALSNAIDK